MLPSEEEKSTDVMLSAAQEQAAGAWQ